MILSRKGMPGWRPVPPILPRTLRVVEIFSMSFVQLCTLSTPTSLDVQQ